jgi:AraC-like DNA-binding protein
MHKIILPSLEHALPGFQLLTALSDTHAWLKDLEGRFICADQLFLRRFGFCQLSELQGKTDYDLAPAHMARQYRKDDQRVLAGELVTDKLELITSRHEVASWFLTSKWPVYDCQENIIGSFGSSRHLNNTDRATIPFRELNAPIEYIRQHFAERITVAQLAASSHLSVSALERRFTKHLSKTPRQYITDIRLDHARLKLLGSTQTLASIAAESGFSDQSHFSRAYRKRFGITPSGDRKREYKRISVD